MPKFRKKPVVIEAVQYTVETCREAHAFLGYGHPRPDDACGLGIEIETMEGTMVVSAGDWIIKGVNGEFYPCKPDIFEKTYEPV